ncbi:unnamed protein product [Ectocarpus sp. 6 AP-2014]
MADDGPPPLQGESDAEEELEEEEDTESEDSEEGGDAESGDEDGGGEDEEEAPPPMWDNSGSEAEEEIPRPPKQSNKAPTKKADKASSGGGGKSGKPAAAAAAAASSKTGKAGKKGAATSGVSPLWTAFAKSREGAERLGFTALKKWQSFAKDMPKGFPGWYSDQVLGSRSVPQALMIEELPNGFPEFCHWVAAENHTSCGVKVKAGFEPFAKTYVKQVEDEGKPVGRSSPPPTPTAAAAGVSMGGSGRGGMAAGAATAGGATFRSGTAPASEPPLGAGLDPKARKRDRRARKGGTVGNGPNIAQKLQTVITELEGVTGSDDYDGREGGAAAKAMAAGNRAEDEVRDLMRGEDIIDESAAATGVEVLGPAFADSSLPNGTLTMLSHLKRARAYRRRADRQQECLENELERCLGRLARVEKQYLALVAETSGQESSLASCLARARPLVKQSFELVGAGDARLAMDGYDDAVKLLEVHVDKAQRGRREAETPEGKEARELLGLALCNRSVASFRLGDCYSGMRDAERAASECPCPMAQEQLKRSKDYLQALGGAAAPPKWAAFAGPP